MSQEPVYCPGCNAKIGDAVNVDGLILLRVGVLLIKDTQAFCMPCGRMVYWSVANRAIARAVKAAMLADTEQVFCNGS